MLLTSDLHLDSKPENNYRWEVFKHLMKHAHDEEIVILGDLADKADRHPSELVNHLINVFDQLAKFTSNISIIMGNHDYNKNGSVYWEFLNKIKKVKFFSHPHFIEDRAYLPYSSNPKEHWKRIDLSKYKVAFIHQTVNGATLKENIFATEDNLPEFPPGLKLYAGDLHIPHIIGQVEYVGAPHRVRFGDRHKCRLLRLNDKYEAEEILLPSIQKEVFQVSSLEALQALQTVEGDQCRVRFTIPASRMEQWPVEQAAIIAWAKEKGVTLASTEAIVELSPETNSQTFNFDADPFQVLEAFCQIEGVEQSIYQTGVEILHNHRS